MYHSLIDTNKDHLETIEEMVNINVLHHMLDGGDLITIVSSGIKNDKMFFKEEEEEEEREVPSNTKWGGETMIITLKKKGQSWSRKATGMDFITSPVGYCQKQSIKDFEPVCYINDVLGEITLTCFAEEPIRKTKFGHFDEPTFLIRLNVWV